MKFTFKKLTAQEMVDRGIDENIYLTDRKDFHVYTFIGIIALLFVGTILALSNPILLASFFN